MLLYLGCNGTPQNITAWSGLVSSPNYPDNYGFNQYCQWRVSVPSIMGIQLVFSYFQLEPTSDCSKDYVELREGSTILGKFCGSKLPPVIYADSGSITITFRSDGNKTDKGFLAKFLLPGLWSSFSEVPNILYSKYTTFELHFSSRAQ